MNIFALSLNQKESARFQLDKHKNKLILEAVQILSTAAYTVHDQSQPWTGYKPGWKHSPLVKWLSYSQENWEWAANYAFAMEKERQFHYRHDTEHKSITILKSLKVPNLPQRGFTRHYQAMPMYMKSSDSQAGYRQYYALGKYHLWAWTRRPEPPWLRMHLRHCLLSMKQHPNHKKAIRWWCKEYPDDWIMRDLRVYLYGGKNEGRSSAEKL